MDKKVILSLCRFATPKLYKKGTFGHFLGTISAEAASSRKTFGATKHGPNMAIDHRPEARTPHPTYVSLP
jgi:hypothetical protein